MNPGLNAAVNTAIIIISAAAMVLATFFVYSAINYAVINDLMDGILLLGLLLGTGLVFICFYSIEKRSPKEIE